MANHDNSAVYKKPNLLAYRFSQFVAFLVSKLIFGCKVIRNEIRGVHTPYVIIANHEAALDFVNLIGVTSKRLNFVVSNSFYSTLPVRPVMDAIRVIPKQQFQTSVSDLKKMKKVVNHGGGLVIYPAGLMCEDGLSTPIPSSTYKFLKWLNVDVYVARTIGSYFVMPKWAKGLRKGRTLLDVYKLYSKEDLAAAELLDIKEKVDSALLFDAYREQEQHKLPYSKCSSVTGLENVLYQCPGCGKEHTIHSKDESTLYCEDCGFEETADSFGLLHNEKGVGPNMTYVSDWSRMIFRNVKNDVLRNPETSISTQAEIRMIDRRKNQFVPVGNANIVLNRDGFTLKGKIKEDSIDVLIPITGIPTLPFSPGKHLEIQNGNTIYRCLPNDGRIIMKIINMVKAFHEIAEESILNKDS